MNQLAKRIGKLREAVTTQMMALLHDYWDDALASDPEAAALSKQLNALFDASTLKPPVFFMPSEDSDTRR